MSVEEHPVRLRAPFASSISMQLRNLLALQNGEFSFTDKTVLCQLGLFIPFHGFLVQYFNQGDDPSTRTGTGTGAASDSIINPENYTVVEVAQAVLFLYVGTISIWPTSITRFTEVLSALGCNPSRVLVMCPMSFALYDHLFGALVLTETAAGSKLRFWSDEDRILTAHFIYASGTTHIEGYSLSLTESTEF